MLSSLLPGGLAAQLCIGMPTTRGEFALAGSVGFPREATALAFEAGYNAAEPISIFVGYSRTRWDGAEAGPIAERFHTVAMGAALELSALWRGLPPALSLCPVASLTAVQRPDLSVVSVPLGLGLGYEVSGPSQAPWPVRVLPYAVPQMVYQATRTSERGPQPALPLAEVRSDFGLEAGALLGYRSLYLGAAVNSLLRDGGSEAAVKLKLGVRL